MDVDTMFSGQVSSVYLFSESLMTPQVAALHWLGPGYKVSYGLQWHILTVVDLRCIFITSTKEVM